MQTLTATLALLAGQTAFAQCEPFWQPGDGLPGLTGHIWGVAEWDRDGEGPLPREIIFAGTPTYAGNVTGNVIAWEPVANTWRVVLQAPFGADAVHVSADNRLWVSEFSSATSHMRVLRRIAPDGTIDVNATASGNVGPISFANLPDGSLVVALSRRQATNGGFVAAIAGRAMTVGRFTGGPVWEPMPGSTGEASALLVRPNGDLILAASNMSGAALTTLNPLSRWDGTTWVPFATATAPPLLPLRIFRLRNLPDGSMLMSGNFIAVDGIACQGAARWDGQQWFPVGNQTMHYVDVAPDGTIFGRSETGLHYRLVGNQWVTLDGSATKPPFSRSEMIHAPAIFPSSLGVVATGMNWLANARVDGLVIFNSQGAITPGPVSNDASFGDITAMTQLRSGAIVAGMFYADTSTPGGFRLCRRVDDRWLPLTTALDERIEDIIELPNGDLIVAGAFNSSNGQPLRRVARWDGTRWHPVGTGPDAVQIFHIARSADGDLIAAGTFSNADVALFNGAAIWQGQEWSLLDLDVTFGNAYVNALATLPDGTIGIGGDFDIDADSGAFAIWNGDQIVQLGDGVTGRVDSFTTTPTGELLLIGWVAPAGNAASPADTARWNGSSWAFDSAPPVTGSRFATYLPGGGLVTARETYVRIGNAFIGNTITRHSNSNAIEELLVTPEGDIVVAGRFTGVRNNTGPTLPSINFARFAPPAACRCDSVDFLRDGVYPDDLDVITFLSVLAGAPCDPPYSCGDIDFNNDQVFPDLQDIVDFFNVLAGGPCPA